MMVGWFRAEADCAHAAFTESFQDLVVPDRRSDHRVDDSKESGLDREPA